MKILLALCAALALSSAARTEETKAGKDGELKDVAAKGELALAHEAVRRDEQALTRDWKDGRAELKALRTREVEELKAARAQGAAPPAKRAKLREIKRRWAETRKMARSRRQLGRKAAKDHLRRARAELERVRAKR